VTRPTVRECASWSEVGPSEAWDALTARAPASLSGSRHWVTAAFAKLHHDALPLLLGVVDGAAGLVGLLPLALFEPRTTPTVRFVGAPHNDLTDLMVLPGHETAVGEVVIERLLAMRDRGWSVRLNDVDPHGALARADRDTRVLSWASDEPAPTVDLSGAWRSAASHRRRGQWDRQLERLSESHVVQFCRIDGRDLWRELPEFLRLREARLHAMGRSIDLPPVAFVEEVIRALAQTGECALTEMRIDGRVAASDLYLLKRQVAMLWLRGLDPSWRRFPCGHLLLRESAEGFASEGFNSLDLGRGDEPYKYLFGAERRVLLQAYL